MTDALHFERPPLDEVVCGVQFAGVEWSIIHFGLFYTEIRERYQRTQQRPPILPAVFDPAVFDPGIQLDPTQVVIRADPDLLPLVWYESDDAPFLLQVQKDAFFVNWRHQSGAFTYPHFHTREGGQEGVGDWFAREWHTFSSFCDQHEIGTPEVLGCHLAYINHMVHGETWDVPADLARWFLPLGGLRSGDSVSLLHMTVLYQVHGLSVRLHFRPAVRIADKKKLFVIELIVNGKLSAEAPLAAWFEHAHTAIVQTFLAQTTQEAHKEWRLS